MLKFRLLIVIRCSYTRDLNKRVMVSWELDLGYWGQYWSIKSAAVNSSATHFHCWYLHLFGNLPHILLHLMLYKLCNCYLFASHHDHKYIAVRVGCSI